MTSNRHRLSQVAPDAPSWLDQIVTRLMKKDPRDRYQNADDVIEAIDRGKALGAQQIQAASGRYAKIALIAVVVVLLALALRNLFKPAGDGSSLRVILKCTIRSRSGHSRIVWWRHFGAGKR